MSAITVYNTQNRSKEPLHPLKEGEISFYVCGPTVYDFFHIGNARIFIVFDVVRRYLEYAGYKVKFVQNFTDIDDKIIKKAQETGMDAAEVATQFIEAYFEDAGSLKIRKADYHPRATENISSIIDIIKKLFDSGLAYESSGDVLFDTGSFPGYGKLSQQYGKDLLAGARVKVDENKRSPLDFVLWKSAKPGEPSWESPWGVGRPGWHIECSAMASSYLGDTIDIHAGGPDLVFPHHENEIAQSEGAFGKTFVKYWLHAGYLNINAEKMSKSRGNVMNIRDLIKRINPLDIRFFMLSSHYRNPLNFNEDLITAAASGRNRLQVMYENLILRLNNALDYSYEAAEEDMAVSLDKAIADFNEAMNDDFNTAEAIGVLFTLAREVNSYLAREKVNKKILGELTDFFNSFNDIFDIIATGLSYSLEDRVEKLIQERNEARKNKEWNVADRIRDELDAEGIILEDTQQGTRWKMK